MSAWRNDFVRVNQYTRPGDKISSVRKIVVHYTANPGASATNHQRYFNGSCIEAGRYASAHIFVDKSDAVCIVPLDEVAYHANDVQKRVNGSPYRGVAELRPNANFLSVGVELCIESNGSFHAQTVDRAVEVVAELCRKFGLSAWDVVRHYDVTSKYCPGPWVDDAGAFEAFKQRVMGALNGSVTSTPASTPLPNRVVVVTADTLNVRSGPSTDYPVVLQVRRGNVCWIVNEKDGWLQDNNNLWMSKQYTCEAWRATVVADTLNVRCGAGTQYNVVLQLHKGDTVFFVEEKDGWVKDNNGLWMSKQYLNIG